MSQDTAVRHKRGGLYFEDFVVGSLTEHRYKPLMNSLFTLGLMIGIQVSDMTVGTTIANLGMSDVKFPHPLFEGDTVHCTTEVLSKRESKSRPGAGIVEFHHRAFNQDNKLVAECRRQAFIRMRPA
jgi:acyl dehydratase